MKKAVIYGAGNIGRGFIGQLFYESGYQTCFIDINEELVQAINSQASYPINIVSASSEKELTVKNVSAVHGRAKKEVARAISQARIMATAVGGPVLPHIAENIAAGLKLRWQDEKAAPLNIILCENLIGADRQLRQLVKARLEADLHQHLVDKVGFVAASVDRMVPIMTEKMLAGNKLRVFAEPYNQLQVDKAAFVGQIPAVQSMQPVSPFAFYERRKIYICNMGHALLAYLGFASGHQYIFQAVRDPALHKITRAGMLASAKALALEHEQDLADLILYVDELLLRFDNPKLADTVERVGRDARRKLSANDRLVGPLDLCLRHKIDPAAIFLGMEAAFYFARQKERLFPASEVEPDLYHDMQKLRSLLWQVNDPASS